MNAISSFLLCLMVTCATAIPLSMKSFNIEKGSVIQMSQDESVAPLQVLHTETETSHIWQTFKDEYRKVYQTAEEDMHRLGVFLTNLAKIVKHNRLHRQGKKSFTLGVNEYADMDHSEFVAVMNGFRRSASNSPRLVGSTYLSPATSVSLPTNVDWRDEGFVTEVKNQGTCGSCWSFSATGSLEGQHYRKSKQLTSLSEQNLVDCSGSWGNNGCNGGLMDQAFMYVKDNNGIDTEQSYPYLARQRKCEFDLEDVGATDSGFVDLPSGDEKKLKEGSATIGPISIAIDASRQSFQLYRNGVYDEPECNSTMLDHGVLLVGYGLDQDGKQYWLVKNSWGTTWGDKGYIRMSRNKDNQCGVASQASYPLV